MSQALGQASSSVYQNCDPVYLRQLREQAGMDATVLAKVACLSQAQIRELEQGTETGVFYSLSIRRQAYKRVLMILGAEPPTAEPVEFPSLGNQEHQAQLQSLDQIAAMSRLPSIMQSPWAPLQALAQRAVEHKQVLGAAALLALSAALLVWNWPQGGTAAMVSSVTEAASSATAAASESAAAVEAVISKPTTTEPAAVVASAPTKPVLVASAAAGVASAPAKPASAPVVPVAPAAALAATSCAFTSEALPQVSPMVPSKPGRYVHFVSGADVVLCVVDGGKQVTTLTLKAGESRSVYGVAPWQVSSSHLNKVQIFFQGWRVTLPSEVTQRMTLVEKAIP